MIEKKENLPLPVVISLMDLSIYLYVSAYLKSNKPSYISYFSCTVRFWTPMWIFFLLCTKSYVASTSFFLSGTIFSQLYLPTCSSLEAYHIHSPNDLYLAFSGRQAICGICTATLHHGKRLCVKGSLIESFFFFCNIVDSKPSTDLFIIIITRIGLKKYKMCQMGDEQIAFYTICVIIMISYGDSTTMICIVIPMPPHRTTWICQKRKSCLIWRGGG